MKLVDQNLYQSYKYLFCSATIDHQGHPKQLCSLSWQHMCNQASSRPAVEREIGVETKSGEQQVPTLSTLVL